MSLNVFGGADQFTWLEDLVELEAAAPTRSLFAHWQCRSPCARAWTAAGLWAPRAGGDPCGLLLGRSDAAGRSCVRECARPAGGWRVEFWGIRCASPNRMRPSASPHVPVAVGTDEEVLLLLLGWALALLPRPHLLYAGTHEFLLLLLGVDRVAARALRSSSAATRAPTHMLTVRGTCTTVPAMM